MDPFEVTSEDEDAGDQLPPLTEAWHDERRAAATELLEEACDGVKGEAGSATIEIETVVGTPPQTIVPQSATPEPIRSSWEAAVELGFRKVVLGYVALDRIVQFDLALLDQIHDAPGGDGLRNRGDPEDGVGGHRTAILAVRLAVGSGPRHLAVPHDGDTRSRNVVICEQVRHVPIERVRKRLVGRVSTAWLETAGECAGQSDTGRCEIPSAWDRS